MRSTPQGRPGQRPLPRGRRQRRAERLLVISGEGSVFDLGLRLVDLVLLPLFESHFGPSRPRAALLSSLRSLALGSRHRGAGRYRLLAGLLAEFTLGARHRGLDGYWLGLRSSLCSWLATEPSPSASSLELRVLRGGSFGGSLAPILAWSRDLDRVLVRLPPLPLWRGFADAMARKPASLEVAAITGLPASLVARSCREAGIAGGCLRVWDDRGDHRAARLLAHIGSSPWLDEAERLALPRFGPGRILLVGDSPGDLGLARAIGAAFHPLRRGEEEASWRRLADELLPSFGAGAAPRSSGLVPPFLASFRPQS